jgi:hypothetical protein
MQGFDGLKLDSGSNKLHSCNGDWIHVVACLIGAGQNRSHGKKIIKLNACSGGPNSSKRSSIWCGRTRIGQQHAQFSSSGMLNSVIYKLDMSAYIEVATT